MKTISPALYMALFFRSILFVAGVVIQQLSFAQINQISQKLSPLLSKDINEGKIAGRNEFIIAIGPGKGLSDLGKPVYKAEKIYESEKLAVFRITATIEELRSTFLSSPAVLFIERANRIPKEELQVGNLDLAVNKINLVHRQYPLISGDGITVSIKENKPDTTDIDFKGRFLTTSLSSGTVSSHASIMATMVAGGGNSWHLGKGAAWGSTISSSSFDILLPDANVAYQQYNISVQNHSYGVGVENYYGADAAAYDASAISKPSLLHVFSSGNSGTSSASTGTYAGLTGFANETGSFKMAKNILTVGATDSFSIVAALSSKGPAYDGRVKPELVAYGEDGSSGAAALVSGTALILQQDYKQLNGSLPPNALIKSILINSADDVGNAEVDYANGYGALNAVNAIKTLQSNQYFSGSVTNGSSQSFNLSIPPGIKKIKVTLVWNDPPAQANADKALINDLDLELTEISSGQIWKPWVLNPFPHPDSLVQLAKRNRDSLNNIEQVTLKDPLPGNYQFKVTGYNIPAGTQNFYLAYQLDTADKFEWQFPTANDFIFPSTSNLLRWRSSFDVLAGKIEYSIDNGNSWQAIQNNVDLAGNNCYWNAPGVISKGLLRMTIGANQFVSDTFTIASRTSTGVGFNCIDSFLFYWNKLPGVKNYRVYQLGSKYLEPFTVTSDSLLLLSKITNPSLHYAVAPIINNKEGVKSYTFNYTIQGVECYIRSFLAFLVNNTAEMTLSLGTLYNINRVVFEKYNGTSYLPLQQINTPTAVLYNFTDAALKKGLNTYRAKLELAGGKVIYSEPVTVYYFAGAEFIVYPNPALQYSTITILSDNQFEPATLQVINMLGQKIYEMKLNDVSNQLPAGRFSKGIYILRITRNGQKDVTLKIFIQ